VLSALLLYVFCRFFHAALAIGALQMLAFVVHAALAIGTLRVLVVATVFICMVLLPSGLCKCL